MIHPRHAGILLMTGVLLPLLVLVMHPTGRELAGDASGHVVVVNHLVHGIAIAGLPLLVVGLAGLCRMLRWSVPATLAFATYLLASASNFVAATMSGFVAPRLVDRGEHAMQLLRYSHDINQAFAGIGQVAAGIALLLWALALWRARMSLLAGIATVAGTLLVGGVLSGWLALDVRGIIIATALQAAWYLPVAWRLLRQDPSLASDSR